MNKFFFLGDCHVPNRHCHRLQARLPGSREGASHAQVFRRIDEDAVAAGDAALSKSDRAGPPFLPDRCSGAWRTLCGLAFRFISLFCPQLRGQQRV